MKFNAFRIIVAVLAVVAVASFFFSYWPVGVGLAIVVIALIVSRALQTRGPKPTE